jgi:4-hydroxy-tetrahydrodipicolinate synthase
MPEPSLPFGRLIPAMITPFDTERKLDLPRAQELAIRLLDGGCDSVLVCGTTGESPTVFYPQKMELFQAVLEAVDGRAPVIANVGDNCTADSVSFAQDVVKLGVDGVMCVVPYYNKPPQEGLYKHFSCIAAGIPDTPIILYNIPGRCVINMEAQTTLRLARDWPNIVALKEASGNMEQVASICEEKPERFNVYSGDDEQTLAIMRLGGAGVISTIANVCPDRMRAIIDAQVSGDEALADELNKKLLPLMQELFVTSNPIMVKEALRILKFNCGGVRLPLVEASLTQAGQLADVMRDTGVL